MVDFLKKMDARINGEYPRLFKVFRYGVSGSLGAAVDLSVFFVLFRFSGIGYIFSAVFSFLAAFAVSFTLQKFWTFRNRENGAFASQIKIYFTIAVMNVCLTALGMRLVVEGLGFHPLLAKIIVSLVIAFESFFLYRLVFRERKVQKTERLLILTQTVDLEDAFLSFFHDWISALSKRFVSLVVVCLRKGKYNLPENVRVFSLGKEKRKSRIRYIVLFYYYILKERKNYDSVFVHMNEEYVLLGGLIWRLLGKKVYMWRNHPAGSALTDLAGLFCTKVFCTSKYSYTAKFKKTILMPVGIDVNRFRRLPDIRRAPRSILFLGRIAPVKRPDFLLAALIELKRREVPFKASFYGDSLPRHRDFCKSLKTDVERNGLSESVFFNPGLPNDRTVDIYNSHAVFVNLTSSGSYDKTIFEAMACQSLVLVCNQNLTGLIDNKFIFEENNLDDLWEKLVALVNTDPSLGDEYGRELRKRVVAEHSLEILRDRLVQEINSQ